jgi:YD repeat-containing protein
MTGGAQASEGEAWRFPRVDLHPDGDGHVTVTVDGHDGPKRVTGERLGRTLDELLRSTGGPIRVVLHDADGTTHHDILTAPPHRAPRAAPDLPEAAGAAGLVEPRFAAGEVVHVAVVVHTTTADADGRLTARHDTDEPTEVGRTVLVGMTSGNVHLRPGR